MTADLPPSRPVVTPGGRVAEAGYAAAARALSAMPPVAGTEAPPPPAAQPGLHARSWRQAGLDGLLPGGQAGFALPLALAALRPDVARWLGEGPLMALGQTLRLEPCALVGLLDTPPLPPAGLGEPARWTGRQVPLRGPDGALHWLDLFWRRETRGAAEDCENYVMAGRVETPLAGRAEFRARLEDGRLDVVMETARPLSRILAADLKDAFGVMLGRLRLRGSLTLRHSQQARET